MPPSLSVVTALARTHQCAPGVAPDTSVSIAEAEGLHAYSAYGNTTSPRFAPETPDAAIIPATDPIVAQDHNVDFDLMQTHCASLPAVDLSIADGFDACHSTRSGSKIPVEAYHHALRASLSTCNTGDPIRGVTNGHVADVDAAATTAPSIVAFAPSAPARVVPTHDVTATAAGAWNIFAEASVVAGAVRWHGEAPK